MPLNFLLLNGRHQLAVAEQRTSGVPENPAQSENDHFDFFSIFAQVSRNPTVRLNTGFASVLSRSTQK